MKSWRAGLCMVFFAGPAWADPSPTERATAEALFQQGTQLMAQKQFAAACEKFDGSLQLDPALGTTLRLADCQDRVGKTASAWAMFREAASMARTRSEPERERIASERALDLEKRLSKLEIKVDSQSLARGLEIRLNGANIPRVTWGTPIPVDPGHQRIEASAPGRLLWSGSVEVPEGPVVRSIEVPALAIKPAEPSPPAEVRAAPAAEGTPTITASSNPRRTIGYVTGGVALAGLAAGGFLFYRAYDSNRSSYDQCRHEDPNACTPEGKTMRDDAKRYAMGSTVAFTTGGALLAGAIVLVLSSPPGEPHRGSLRFSTMASANGAGLKVTGVW
jgi:hypothetical protein